MPKIKENKYQAHVIEKVQEMFPGCIVLKNDPNYLQGIPDLEIIHEGKYAFLETKREQNAKHRPNQDYYVDKLNNWSFARFIFPENEAEVLNELQRSFKA